MDYYKLDEKDIVILENLTKDSRIKLNALAEILNTSIPTIRSRIDKLEALGIIQQFSIVLSYDLLSEHPSYFIMLRIQPKSINTTLEFLYDKREVMEIHELIGTFQILLKTLPLSTPNFQSLLQGLRSLEGIVEINPMPMATTHKLELARLPSKDIQVKLRCEWKECNKIIEKNYQTIQIDEVTHFFCCTSCLSNYKELSSKRVI